MKKHKSRPRPSTVKVISRKPTDGRYEDILKAVGAFETNQVPDPFANYYTLEGRQTAGGTLQVIPPPFNPYALLKVPFQNNTLLQCIDAMVTNCELGGHTLVFVGKKGQENSREAMREKERIEDLLEQPSGSETFKGIRSRLRRNLETLGYWFLEVGRDSSGEVSWFDWVPAETMRVCRIDETDVEVETILKRNGKETRIKTIKHFRRYVQSVGSKKIWFKEFGDPRVINKKNGGEGVKNEANEATEILHFKLYEGTYGMPRWVNNIPAALGSRESELVNLQFFKDNAIPAMAILVSGGYLTAETVEDLEEHFSSVTGKDSINRVLIIEAKPDEESVGSVDQAPPTPVLSLQPLAGDRQSDALFQNYDEANMQKIRSSFRLPPIFLGKTEEYSRATADASVDVAENQVFGPERNAFDDVINNKLLAYDGKSPQFWKVRSNVTKLSDAGSIMEALNTLNGMGAVTPNLGIQMVREFFGVTIEDIKEPWGNVSWALLQSVMSQGSIVSPQAQGAVEELQKMFDKLGFKAKGGTQPNMPAEGNDEGAVSSKQKTKTGYREGHRGKREVRDRNRPSR